MLANIVDQDWMQYGFAGFSGVLILVIIWLLTKFIILYEKLINVVKDSNRIQSKHIESLHNVERSQNDTKSMIVEMDKKIDGIKLKLVSRPCLKDA